MKKIIYMMFMLTGIIMMTACSNPVEAENLDLNKEVARLVEENQELKKDIIEIEQKNEELTVALEEIKNMDLITPEDEPDSDPDSELKPEVQEPEMGYIKEPILNIYWADENTYEKEPVSQVSINHGLDLEGKLNEISDVLSSTIFEGLGITVDKIEEQDGKQIATINLTESTNENDVSWIGIYFQGSTGGAITSVALEETFLQREYNGEWIDGVKFLYNGEKIEFDHVAGLSEISYR